MNWSRSHMKHVRKLESEKFAEFRLQQSSVTLSVSTSKTVPNMYYRRFKLIINGKLHPRWSMSYTDCISGMRKK